MVLSEPPPVVWVVHSDSALREARVSALRQSGLLVTPVTSATRALKWLENFIPDLILFEEVNEDTVAAQFSATVTETLGNLAPPVIYIVAARETTEGLTSPIDRPRRDVVFQKPVLASHVLRAALSMLRRAAEARSALRGQDLELDVTQRFLAYRSRNIRVTRLECRFLEYLMRHQGHVVSGDALLRGVWGYDPGTGTLEVVRANVRNLRRKLALLGAPPDLIRTLPGRGYQLKEA